MSVNPDVVETREFIELARELIKSMKIDWSKLYAHDTDTVVELRDIVLAHFIDSTHTELLKTCPLMCDYILQYEGKENWPMVAMAVDNLNGMYHPLRLTKVVMGAAR